MADEPNRVLTGGRSGHRIVEESPGATGVLAEHQLGEGALADLPSTGHDDDAGVVESLADELGRSSRKVVTTYSHPLILADRLQLAEARSFDLPKSCFQLAEQHLGDLPFRRAVEAAHAGGFSQRGLRIACT